MIIDVSDCVLHKKRSLLVFFYFFYFRAPRTLQSITSSYSFVFYFVVLERRFRRDEAGRALRAPCDRVDVWEGFGWIRLVS